MALLKRRSAKIEQLKEVPLFSSLNQKELAQVARHVDEVEVAQGHALTTEGQMGKEFGLILEGSASVRRGDRKIATLGPGDFFGEMSLLDSYPRSASVIADEPCVLLVMHSKDFSSVLNEVPAISRKLLVGLSHRLREANKRLL